MSVYCGLINIASTLCGFTRYMRAPYVALRWEQLLLNILPSPDVSQSSRNLLCGIAAVVPPAFLFLVFDSTEQLVPLAAPLRKRFDTTITLLFVKYTSRYEVPEGIDRLLLVFYLGDNEKIDASTSSGIDSALPG